VTDGLRTPNAFVAADPRTIMARADRSEYLVLREFGDDADLEAAFDRIGEHVADLRHEGVGLEWLESETLAADEDGGAVATLDRFRADERDALADHAEAAAVPVTRIWTVAAHREGDNESRREAR
jgi:hypothetical protein